MSPDLQIALARPYFSSTVYFMKNKELMGDLSKLCTSIKKVEKSTLFYIHRNTDKILRDKILIRISIIVLDV